MTYRLHIEPQSDDHIEVAIYEGSRRVFVDEFGHDKLFVINEEFSIHVSFQKDGWHTDLKVIDEDKLGGHWSDYEMKMITNGGFYAFGVALESKVPIAIEGIYGDKKSLLLNIIQMNIFDCDRKDAEELYNALEPHFK